MRIVVPTYVHVEKLLLPRCRKPRSGCISIEAVCELEEIQTAAVLLAAHITTREVVGPCERDYYFEPSVGFLLKYDRGVEGLTQVELGYRGERGDVPEAMVPGQGQYEIARKRQEVAAHVAGFVVSDQGTVYRKVSEPCYCVEYRPSFNWSTCNLVAREAPDFTPECFSPRRGWDRLFSAMALREAIRLKEALVRRMGDQLDGHDEHIDVLSAEAFTFDADRWHAEQELYCVRDKVTELIEDLRRTPGDDLAPFCAEQVALADWLSGAEAAMCDQTAPERLRAQAAVRITRWIQSVEEGDEDGDLAPEVR